MTENNKIDHYDTIIIGGGIVGAGIFRDQALHNKKVLLLEQGDFSSQTSQGSSKMLHGGIRYLENLDFALVFEALKEKNLWLKLTPHIAKEIPFYLPVYRESKWPLFLTRFGLFLYDLLSLFKNSPHNSFGKKKTLEKIPGIRSEGLRGSGMYFDGIVDDAKLGLECIYDGLNNKNCHALNYKKVIKYERNNDGHLITYQDVFNSTVTQQVKCKDIIFATGPFTDQVMKNLNIDWKPVILPSKGTHLWLKPDSLPIKEAMVLQTKDKRIIFVIPQRESILVGTTEIPLKDNESFFDIKPDASEIQYLLDCVNEYFPKANVRHEHIQSSFAAVRPLVRSSKSSKKTSRNHEIYQPQPHMWVLVGGKYTTFRRMAEDLNKKIFKQNQEKYNKRLSLSPLRTTSIVKSPVGHNISKEEIQKILDCEFVKTKEDLIYRRLSLPSFSHMKDEELRSMIQNINFSHKKDNK